MGGLPTNKTVNGFSADPSNLRVMYVAMDDGLFRSADAGETWKALGKNLKDLKAVTVNPKKPNEVYTVTARGIIFKSSDGGTHWKRQG
ncbi:MAG: WD40/YVTN/BNR-like repeat-containing protein [Alphaproteobacteria bacterium]